MHPVTEYRGTALAPKNKAQGPDRPRTRDLGRRPRNGAC